MQWSNFFTFVFLCMGKLFKYWARQICIIEKSLFIADLHGGRPKKQDYLSHFNATNFT